MVRKGAKIIAETRALLAEGLGAPALVTPWGGIVSRTVAGVRPKAIEAALGAQGIAVRAGLHCAPWAHRWLGTLGSGGAVRVSVGWYNKRAEVEKLSSLLEEAIRG